MSARESVLVLCVNYHSEEDAAHLAQEMLSQEESCNLHLLMVDNSDSLGPEHQLQQMASQDRRLQILNPKANLGYFGAAWYGMNHYLQTNPLPNWIIVSNPDILLPDQKFFSTLFSLSPEGERPAILAPTIESALTGADQNPYIKVRPTAKMMVFRKWMFQFYPVSIGYQLLALFKAKLRDLIGKSLAPTAKPKAGKIYAGHGSFIIFHKSFFEAGGTLKHGVFLFGEEIHVAESAQRLNLKSMYQPALRVIHNEHATTGIIKSRKMAQFQKEATAYCASLFTGGQAASPTIHKEDALNDK